MVVGMKLEQKDLIATSKLKACHRAPMHDMVIQCVEANAGDYEVLAKFGMTHVIVDRDKSLEKALEKFNKWVTRIWGQQ